MQAPFQGLQRHGGAFGWFPSGKATITDLRCCTRLTRKPQLVVHSCTSHLAACPLAESGNTALVED